MTRSNFRVAIGGLGKALVCMAAVVATLLWVATADATVAGRVSVGAGGVQADYESGSPSLSADGRYAAFVSAADNLVAGDTNGRYDIFVCDRQTGSVRRVSVATGGGQADGDSRAPYLSGDGKCVAFVSKASNLVSGDSNGRWDVFVYTLATGVARRVSVATDGTQADGDSGRVALNGDGSLACFTSRASNLVASDSNGSPDVFVHDCVAGTTERVSVGADGAQADRWSDFASISADGRYVAFDSLADNLVTSDTNGKWDVFVRDRQAGTTVRVSVDSAGTQAAGDSLCPSLSSGGGSVAFESVAGDLVGGDTAGKWDVFVHDLATGVTERVSVSSGGVPGGADSDCATISGDGRFVAFVSQSTGLVPGDGNGMRDVFVRDRVSGTTQRVSISATGLEGSDDSDSPALSSGGGLVAFESWADKLVSADTDRCADVFVAEVVAVPSATDSSKGTPSDDSAADDFTHSSAAQVQQNDSRVTYLGPWGTLPSASASGGDLAYTEGVGAAVVVSFEGSYLAWVAAKGPQYGMASVSVDGGAPALVDLFSASPVFCQEVYDTGLLTEGPHKVTIQVGAGKNASSSGHAASVDALNIVGSLTQSQAPVRYEEWDVRISFGGLWTSSASPAASWAALDYAASAGSTANIAFKGTYVAWIAKTGPQYGKAAVSLDGGAAWIVDLYSPVAGYRRCVYYTGLLEDTDHVLSISWTGEKHGASVGTLVDIDAIDILGTVTSAPLPSPVSVTYQQTDPRLTYLGTWSKSSTRYASGGSFYYGARAGSSVTACFQGTSVEVLAKTGPQYGIARISLDGGPPRGVDFYSRGNRYQQIVYSAGGLEYGAHTLVIEWTGQKRSSARARNIDLDAIRVVGVLCRAPKPVIYQQNDSHLVYAGPWATGYGARASGRTLAYLPSKGSVTINFAGSSLCWITRVGPQYGIARLTLDGGAPFYVDLYRRSVLDAQRFYVTGVRPYTTHTLVIERSGSKNRHARGYLLGLDALEVVGSLR